MLFKLQTNKLIINHIKTWELLEENTNKQANHQSYKDMGIIRRECRAVFNQKECTDTNNKN